ncbi:two-component system sensor histidine kinase YesM [Hydrogenispora ethanolica]|uniref:Two-component system sensor histidine kinase YesM n=1 Tax=Hydrogenispora ethanolica TaxID=1082276 RepID=A0A4R1RV81_HYDET|nr:sensor histidine kinase [Hydrogenispora ethanolica]TCL70020.1 two-component system sensor histidine kinase YesM [Hydrogenispora ethanolica]
MEIKTNTFKKNLILFLVPLLIPLLLLGAFSIIITRHYVQDEINQNNFNLLQQTKKNLDLIFDELDSLNLSLGMNPEILVALKRIFDASDSKVSLEDYHSLQTIANFIGAPANARPYIHSIYVYFDNRQRKMLTTIDGLTSVDRFFDRTWYQSYLRNQSNGLNFWSEARQVREYPFKKNPTEVWTIYRKVYSTSGSKKSIGVIVLNIYTDYLRQSFETVEIPPSQVFLIVDEDDRVVFSNKPVDSLEREWVDRCVAKRDSSPLRFGGVSYAVSQIDSEKYRLRYISVIPHKVLYKVPTELQSLTALLLAVSFGLGLLLTYYLTKKNHHQVQEIIAIIDAVRNGRPFPRFPSTIKDEYSYITHNILKTFIEQNYLKIQLSERKYRLQFMELLALQAQINPHFLFNTLETLKWKIFQFTGKPNEATEMLEDLAEILHYSLESPGRKVTIEEEIHNTQNYLEIQKIRYRNKFDIIWEYDEDVKTLPIIRLLFQPLLENSIYHGIKEKPGPSLIKIKIRRQGAFLRIAVIDNGLGMTGEKLRQIRWNLDSAKYDGPSIGLYNTNKRLLLTYGPASAIRIRSKFHGGTAIDFRVPLAGAEEALPSPHPLAEESALPFGPS